MNNFDEQRARLTYDTSFNPLSFDLIFCFAIVRALCDLNRLPSKFDLVILNRTYRSEGIEAEYSQEYREKKFRDVIVSSSILCNWINSIQIIRGTSEAARHKGPQIPSEEALSDKGTLPQWKITPMVPKQLETLYQQGARLPDYGFSASQQMLNKYRDRIRGGVVIHPRVSAYWEVRNTDKMKIESVIQLLKLDGIPVFFVPDIEDLSRGFGWSDLDAEPLVEASYDMEARLAAAECAAVNLLLPGGGNTSILQFSSARFLITGFLDESTRLTSSVFYSQKGPSKGTNPPWLNENTQVYDWTPKSEVSAGHIHERLISLLRF